MFCLYDLARAGSSQCAAAPAGIALESLALAVLYARYSLELAATNPLVWVVVMALMAAFVAYGRYARR